MTIDSDGDRPAALCVARAAGAEITVDVAP